jgi:hypothetical protein
MATEKSIRTHLKARHAPKRPCPVVCTACGKRFVPTRSWQKFHSANCRKRAWDEKRIIEMAIRGLETMREQRRLRKEVRPAQNRRIETKGCTRGGSPERLSPRGLVGKT